MRLAASFTFGYRYFRMVASCKAAAPNDLQLPGLWGLARGVIVGHAGVMRYPDGGGLTAADRALALDAGPGCRSVLAADRGAVHAGPQTLKHSLNNEIQKYLHT